MLPPEHIKWFSTQSDSMLSSTEIRKERHAVRYLHIGVEFDTTVFFLERFIGDSLTKNLDKLQRPMVEEIRENTDRIFGTDEDGWKTLNVYDSLQDIILPAMSRIFFGLPLGRDPKFLASFKRYVLAMGIGTIVIGQLPRMFKGLLVPLFNVPLRYYRGKTLKELVPMVERQLIETRNAEPHAHEERYDLIAQSARVSTKLSAIRNVADSGMLAEWILLLVHRLASGGKHTGKDLADTCHRDLPHCLRPSSKRRTFSLISLVALPKRKLTTFCARNQLGFLHARKTGTTLFSSKASCFPTPPFVRRHGTIPS